MVEYVKPGVLVSTEWAFGVGLPIETGPRHCSSAELPCLSSRQRAAWAGMVIPGR